MRPALRSISFGILALLSTCSLAGCFRSPDMTRISCTTTAYCPRGYQCVMPPGQPSGSCQMLIDGGAVDGGAAADGFASPDLQSTIDNPSTVNGGVADSRPPVDVAVGTDGSSSDAAATVDVTITAVDLGHSADSSVEARVVDSGPPGTDASPKADVTGDLRVDEDVPTSPDSAPAGPTVTAQPRDATIIMGASVTFTVAATGTGTLSYRWYQLTPTGPVALGSTGASLTITPAPGSGTPTPPFTNQYYCVVTDGDGYTTQSRTAALTVYPS